MLLHFSVQRPARTVVAVLASVFLLATAAGSGAVHAGETVKIGTPRDRDWFVTFNAYRWVEERLPRLPGSILTGDLDFEDSYLATIGVSKVIVQDFEVPIPFTGWVLDGYDLEIEAQLGQHWGNQDHQEATLGVLVRTGDLDLLFGTSVNFAGGIGASYAFERPAFEKGAGGGRGEGSRHWQSYITFEYEFTHEALPNVHLLAKLHHRSGIYGLISPRRTGSNFIGGGLRIDLP